jgi:hypothetical protein
MIPPSLKSSSAPASGYTGSPEPTRFTQAYEGDALGLELGAAMGMEDVQYDGATSNEDAESSGTSMAFLAPPLLPLPSLPSLSLQLTLQARSPLLPSCPPTKPATASRLVPTMSTRLSTSPNPRTALLTLSPLLLPSAPSFLPRTSQPLPV